MPIAISGGKVVRHPTRIPASACGNVEPLCFHRFVPACQMAGCVIPPQLGNQYVPCGAIQPPPQTNDLYLIDGFCWFYQDDFGGFEQTLFGPFELQTDCDACCSEPGCWLLSVPCACSQPGALEDLYVPCDRITEDVVFSFEGRCYQVGPNSDEVTFLPDNVALPEPVEENCETCCDNQSAPDCLQCSPVICPNPIVRFSSPRLMSADGGIQACQCTLQRRNVTLIPTGDPPVFITAPFHCAGGTFLTGAISIPEDPFDPDQHCSGRWDYIIIDFVDHFCDFIGDPNVWGINISVSWDQRSDQGCNASNDGFGLRYSKNAGLCPGGTYAFDSGASPDPNGGCCDPNQSFDQDFDRCQLLTA